MSTDRLPYLDEHATEVEAGVEEVWPALLDAVDRAFSGAATRWYAVGRRLYPPRRGRAAAPRRGCDDSRLPRGRGGAGP